MLFGWQVHVSLLVVVGLEKVEALEVLELDVLFSVFLSDWDDRNVCVFIEAGDVVGVIWLKVSGTSLSFGSECTVDKLGIDTRRRNSRRTTTTTRTSVKEAQAASLSLLSRESSLTRSSETQILVHHLNARLYVSLPHFRSREQRQSVV